MVISLLLGKQHSLLGKHWVVFGGIHLAAAQDRHPSLTKSPCRVSVPKAFWQDWLSHSICCDIPPINCCKKNKNKIYSLVFPDPSSSACQSQKSHQSLPPPVSELHGGNLLAAAQGRHTSIRKSPCWGWAAKMLWQDSLSHIICSNIHMHMHIHMLSHNTELDKICVNFGNNFFRIF